MAQDKKEKKEKLPQWTKNPLNETVRDYRVYELSVGEKILYGLLAFVIGGLMGLLFYGGLFKLDGEPTLYTYIADVAVFALAGGVAAVAFLPIRAHSLLEKQRKELRTQFRDMLESLTASLAANGTIYDAFLSAHKDMQSQYSSEAYITKELEQISFAIQNNIDIEEMLDDFAERSGIEDIQDFADVFRIARGPGGNISAVMRQTHDIIGDKMTIEDEIDSKMSSNKLELNIIMIAPFIIVAMLRFTNPSFAESFVTLRGVLVSTGAIIIFFVAYLYGQKIIRDARK